MQQSPYVEIARRYLSPWSRAWEHRTQCKEIAAGLRADGEHDLAAELEQAARGPEPWLGNSAGG